MPHIQSTIGSNFGANVAVAFGSGNAAGNCLFAVIASTTNTTGVTDTRGNTWAKATELEDVPNSLFSDIWYAMNCAAGANTVTAASGSSSDHTMAIAEYSEVALTAALDKVAATSGFGNPEASAATATTTQADELLIGALISEGVFTMTFGGSFTERQDGGASKSVALGERIVAATGAYAVSGTLSTDALWQALIATFKLNVGPPVTPVIRPSYEKFPKVMIRQRL